MKLAYLAGISLLLWGCTVTVVAPPNAVHHPRVDKAWEYIKTQYTRTDIVREVLVTQLEDGVAGTTPWTPGDIIYIDASYAETTSDLELEATIVHEFYHIFDMKVNNYKLDKLELMESRANRAEGRYIEYEICKGRTE